MRELGQLNTSTFFCQGCGISPRPEAGTDCPTCVAVTNASWNSRQPMPLKVHIAFALALAVLIVGIVFALRI